MLVILLLRAHYITVMSVTHNANLGTDIMCYELIMHNVNNS